MEEQMASVRYIVSDVSSCVDFYRDRLGFKVEMHPGPGFAALSRDDLRLYLNAPGAGSAGKAGEDPEPGGWNRFQIETDDLDGLIGRLRDAGARFRGTLATGRGGRQILLEDPSGNVIELFEPAGS
jgi:catechol 2,3-dioxygenase-like lactoylglutathione lyase family enzyme